jgi:hypothetical protein
MTIRFVVWYLNCEKINVLIISVIEIIVRVQLLDARAHFCIRNGCMENKGAREYFQPCLISQFLSQFLFYYQSTKKWKKYLLHWMKKKNENLKDENWPVTIAIQWQGK